MECVTGISNYSAVIIQLIDISNAEMLNFNIITSRDVKERVGPRDHNQGVAKMSRYDSGIRQAQRKQLTEQSNNCEIFHLQN